MAAPANSYPEWTLTDTWLQLPPAPPRSQSRRSLSLFPFASSSFASTEFVHASIPFPFPPLSVPLRSFVRAQAFFRSPACVQILADFSEKARNPPASERFSLPPPSGRPRALINSSHLPPADSYPARSNSPLSSSGWCFASPGSGRLLAQFGLRTIGFDLPLGEPELESYPGDSSTVRSPSPAPLPCTC
jgi:hypothetical protein